MRTSSTALVVLSAAVAVGCAGEGPSSRPTDPVPSDRLVVTLQDRGSGSFRLDLDCAVADRDACSAILSAIGDAEKDKVCQAAPSGGDASVAVSGTIGGDRVRSLLTRRTDCEIRAYDRTIDALGL